MTEKAKKPRMNINIESLFFGDEPVFDDPKKEIGFSRSLSWYSTQYGTKESKNYTLEYAKTNSFSKETQKKLASADETLFKNLGFICRMVSRGATLGLDKFNWIDDRINEIINSKDDGFSSQLTPSVQTNKQEKTIQDKVFEYATQYINEIEGHIDIFIKKRSSEFKCYEWLVANSIKPIYINQVKQHYIPLFNELSSALNKQDEQLVESYADWTRKELKSFLDFVAKIISDCDNYTGNAKVTRKPRKKKAVPLEKKVSSVKFQKESTEYKIVSVSPTEIIGARQLWVFNTKYKQLGLYKSQDDSGFSIKGTTICGFDENASICKTLRKPLDTLEEFKKAKKTDLKKFLSNLSTKESTLNGRINSDTILLKVIK